MDSGGLNMYKECNREATNTRIDSRNNTTKHNIKYVLKLTLQERFM